MSLKEFFTFMRGLTSYGKCLIGDFINKPHLAGHTHNTAIIYFTRYRSDSREFVQRLLSEESKRKRKRSNAINIQITFITWLFEFSAGILCAVVYFIDSKVASRWLAFLDMTLNFILVPSSYIINNDVNKALIVAHGWIQGLRRMFSPDSQDQQPQDNQIVPENENRAPERSAIAANKTIQQDAQQGRTEDLTGYNEPSTIKAANSTDGQEETPISEQASTSNGNNSMSANEERTVDSSSQYVANQSDGVDDLQEHRSENEAKNDLEVAEEGIVTITIEQSEVEYKTPQSKIKSDLHPMKNNWIEKR